MKHTVALCIPILGDEMRDLELQHTMQQDASVEFSNIHLMSESKHPSIFFYFIALS